MKQVKITFEQLPEALGQLIVQVGELKEMLAKLPDQSIPKEEKYLTPAELTQSLQISMVTLWHWDKKGITQPLRIGNLKRYRLSDLEKIVTEYGKKNL